MDEKKFAEIQYQMRENQQELQDFMKDMDRWETDIKKKDETLKSSGEISKQELPPIRNSLDKKKFKKKKKTPNEKEGKSKPKKIKAYDFRAWDKFDVDKACDEINENEEKISSSEYETDEEWEEQRRKQQANVDKDMGNRYFKDGEYENAIRHYTTAIECDADNAILPANRAMALLKQNKFTEAEVDCTAALALDPTYTKAYSRRATARVGLKKLQEASDDFEQVLKLEPTNKQALTEIDKINKELNPQDHETLGIIKPVYKPPKLRSKKPLRRIEIEEIGDDDDNQRQQSINEQLENQSKKEITKKDDKQFESFTKIKNNHSLQNGDVQNVDQYKVAKEDSSLIKPFENITTSKLKQLPSEEQERSSPVSSPRQQTSLISFDIPQTSYQLQSDWKVLRHNTEEFSKYIEKINPTMYPKLFGEMLDSDVLVMMLLVFRDYYMRNNLDAIVPLQCLTKVKRFDMVSMFLSSPEKKVVKELFESLKKTNTESNELRTLSRLYGV